MHCFLYLIIYISSQRKFYKNCIACIAVIRNYIHKFPRTDRIEMAVLLMPNYIHKFPRTRSHCIDYWCFIPNYISKFPKENSIKNCIACIALIWIYIHKFPRTRSH